jgi:hypothetical protein
MQAIAGSLGGCLKHLRIHCPFIAKPEFLTLRLRGILDPISRNLDVVTQTEQHEGQLLSKSDGLFHPRTDFEREEVRKQLLKILESPVFQNSKRYASVLKYVVNQTLEGHGDRLKERTIGIEVFHRAPDYDTATDHAVRSAVAEVRKRLAQYYQQDTGAQLKIEVLPGSYMPQFRRSAEDSLPRLVVPPLHRDTAAAPAIALPIPVVAANGNRGPWGRLAWIAAACLILCASVAAMARFLHPDDPFDSFWRPILSSRAPVLLCIGNEEGGLGAPGDNRNLSPTVTLSDFQNLPIETVNEHDAITVSKLAALLVTQGRSYELKSQSDATFTDLQRGPAILVGLLNNNWTERLVPKLRFTVQQNGKVVVIRDRNQPSAPGWSVDYATPYLDVTRDYALLLRMVDPKTEQTVVVVAGITVFGTSAAGNLLINRKEMEKLAAVAPPGWEKKNMELVLSTDVIRGRSGPANIVAAQFW